MNIEVREASWENDKDVLRDIRKIVFIEGQNVPQELEWDERDAVCWHVLVTLDDKPVATGRLDNDGKIGRMAVLNEHRGSGLGKQVLQELIKIARRENIARTYMHAQCHALDFYLKNGFEAVGEVYNEAGIPHQNAQEIITPEHSSSKPLGFSDAIKVIDDTLASAGHHLYIKAQRLSHPVLVHEQFIQTLKNKLINSKRFLCHILLEDLTPSKRSAEFVRYYQRLTDYIEIRRYTPDHAGADRRQYVIIDNKLLAWQSFEGSHDMKIFTEADRIQTFSDAFAATWNSSEQDLSLSKFYI